MGLSPRVVTEDVTFLWDGVPQRLPKGQVIDVAPGSPLERAIGLHRLIPHGLPAPVLPPAVTAEASGAAAAPPAALADTAAAADAMRRDQTPDAAPSPAAGADCSAKEGGT